jgi:flavin reductase (DIM6/NTAB) family NADH-FMN oxidoreductase RutF
LSGAEFRRACASFATGITVVTVTDAAGTPHGLTANSFTSVSLDPPIVLVCVGHQAAAHRHLTEASAFAVNVLREEQKELSVRFATRGTDRFTGVSWHLGAGGAPLIEGCLATIECRAKQQVEAGDHTVFLGEVERVEHTSGSPLIYYASHYRQLK